MGSLPTLIVLDMHLPGTDGKHILAQIRANDRLKGVRVVIAMADASMTHGKTGSQADCVPSILGVLCVEIICY